MTTNDDFVRQIALAPRDWQTLLVYADWLEKQNECTIAAGYRAVAGLRKVPWYWTGSQVYGWWGAGCDVDTPLETRLSSFWYEALWDVYRRVHGNAEYDVSVTWSNPVEAFWYAALTAGRMIAAGRGDFVR